MNTTDDGQPVGEDMPVGYRIEPTLESPVARILDGADRITAQGAALDDIRRFIGTVDAKPFPGPALDDFKLSGEKACAAVITAILERYGLT